MFLRNFGSFCLLVVAVLASCSASRMNPDPEGPCAARLQRCGLSARPGQPTNCCRKSPYCLNNDGVDSRCV
ncbi:unnamed protein product [Timema podura]|uniref:Uncharacterized protein n=1 Tax=Timema podura TaxID=61482 RepID=A0ABN7NP24_TIMPD|nr:unnamed protein product [Timema podura]